jgi:hypothetical protein
MLYLLVNERPSSSSLGLHQETLSGRIVSRLSGLTDNTRGPERAAFETVAL